MAKTSAVERNKKRVKMAASAAARRARLKALVMNREASPEERFDATLKLAEMPRNSATVRQRNRCELSGRSRGTYRKFKLGRVMLRDLASFGQIPGMTKSSW
ncbi:30S ribosomal subunit protein S14 [uncultured Alphaproteobacteria bacterium]|uniref:Small ribosomal subunit protein uS14 n=1 Tax=uncultured Alphaproteobacteria bacterium TaxID=91750 RepID=A0A212KMS8_9PROT|nr:30S ribosomal subunit protein S14 [uncultured Alphaproteobacteria bacterium]